MARVAARWRTLADIQRAAWNASGGQVQSHSQLGRSGPLKGYNLYIKINSNLADLGENPVFDRPDCPQFSENLIGDFTIANIGGVIGLKLSVPATPVRHTLVLATRPGSPGASFLGRFVFLGLLLLAWEHRLRIARPVALSLAGLLLVLIPLSARASHLSRHFG